MEDPVTGVSLYESRAIELSNARKYEEDTLRCAQSKCLPEDHISSAKLRCKCSTEHSSESCLVGGKKDFMGELRETSPIGKKRGADKAQRKEDCSNVREMRDKGVAKSDACIRRQ